MLLLQATTPLSCHCVDWHYSALATPALRQLHDLTYDSPLILEKGVCNESSCVQPPALPTRTAAFFVDRAFCTAVRSGSLCGAAHVSRTNLGDEESV